MQLLADELEVPLIYLVDAAGARIDEQFDSYAGRHAWGNIFYNQVQISGRVPQLCALFGPSPAGGGLRAGLVRRHRDGRGHRDRLHRLASGG
jgi:acetyl-CoA carboxylase carboxyltransferase component